MKADVSIDLTPHDVHVASGIITLDGKALFFYDVTFLLSLKQGLFKCFVMYVLLQFGGH